VPISHRFLLPWSLLLAVASACQTGWVITENGQVGYILSEKLNWDENGNAMALMTLCTVIGSLGIAIGSMIGGMIGTKYGIRRVLIITNVLNLAFCGLKLIENTHTIIIGRFLHGLGCGILNFCFGKALNDTVPDRVSQGYGMFTNSGICLGIFVSNFIGFWVPALDEDGLLALKNDQNWRIVYGFPMIMQLFSVILIVLFVPEISLKKLLLEDESKEKALVMIRKIYRHDDAK
jgi:MFS family permease